MKTNLKQIRESQRLTIENIADICTLSKSTVHHLESGKDTEPKLSTAYKIARALGVTVQDIWPDFTEVVDGYVKMLEAR